MTHLCPTNIDSPHSKCAADESISFKLGGGALRRHSLRAAWVDTRRTGQRDGGLQVREGGYNDRKVLDSGLLQQSMHRNFRSETIFVLILVLVLSENIIGVYIWWATQRLVVIIVSEKHNKHQI